MVTASPPAPERLSFYFFFVSVADHFGLARSVLDRELFSIHQLTEDASVLRK
jgi:hypothetical protein